MAWSASTARSRPRSTNAASGFTGRGYVTDIQLLSRPWGFAPEAIRVPVQLWHGDQDAVIPLGHARFLAAAIPASSLVVCPGEGHMLMWNHLEEIVRWARAGGGSRLVA